MNEKLPAPCEHCKGTGLSHGSECTECRGKGYRLIINGRHKGGVAGIYNRAMYEPEKRAALDTLASAPHVLRLRERT